MCLTTYLAFVIGAYLLLTNLAYLLNRTYYKKFMSDLGGNDALIYVTGALAVIFGLLILTCHNIWVSDWPVLITLFGWITLFQGIGKLFIPEQLCKCRKQFHMKNNYWIISLVWALVGIYLIYEGYVTMSNLVV